MEDPRSDATDRGTIAGAPRWVRVLGVGLLILIVLLIVLQVAGEGLYSRPPPVT